MMDLPNTLLHFWAKTSHTKEFQNAFHPLICHLIDVAAVTKAMWENVLPKASQSRINRAFGLSDAGNFVAWIAGLHDLGKCSPPFALRGLNEVGKNGQTVRLLELYRNSEFWLGSVAKTAEAPHGFITSLELPTILETFGFNSYFARQIGVLIGGHHGIFPNSDWQKGGRYSTEKIIGNQNWERLRVEHAKVLAELFDVREIEQPTAAKLDNATIMILTGLVSVADWIGSDTQFFECAVSDSTAKPIKLIDGSLENYLSHAEEKANEALVKLGWVFRERKNSENVSVNNQNTADHFAKLFPYIKERRHLQDIAIEIGKELKETGIAVIEAPMGEGKTEAAMYLADAWNTLLDQTGYYFALPTQATSDQMFTRARDFLECRFPGQNTNLQLLHGHASLSAELELLKEGHKRILQSIYDDENHPHDECTPSVVASEWFTYRKRGLLAPFGVGTIDQALMAVLQTRHVFVRLFGLAHKTVIIDEVHAYDAYMSTLLKRLLEWLAALGSSVVLLSATLPKGRRNALIQAYQAGLGKVRKGDKPIIEGEDTYPRIAYATDETMKVRKLETSDQNRKILHIEKVGDDFAKTLKGKLAKDGGCVAIICNTVGRAQELYQQLADDAFFENNLDLLHSRFRFCDREERERRILENFGKPDENGISPNRPKRAVLISTQIIEQSLDLDFDLMISDLAPIDLLLQRAGRLHRHERYNRPNELKTPTLRIVQPPTDENGKLFADKKGLPDFGKAGLVYDKHILLRTWLELNKERYEKIEIPGEIEDLIEVVYDLEKSLENSDENLKGLWQASLIKYLEDKDAEKKQAEYRYIKHPRFTQHISGIFAGRLEEDSPDVHQTLQAATRLTEPTVSVICLWKKGGKIFLDEAFLQEIDMGKRPCPELTKNFLRSSVNISKKSVVFKFFKEDAPKAWRESPLLRHHRVLEFDENRNCKKFGHLFRLDEKIGLQIT